VVQPVTAASRKLRANARRACRETG